MTHPFNAKQTFELADGSNGVIFKLALKMLDCANFPISHSPFESY